jgi:hypothetical protein
METVEFVFDAATRLKLASLFGVAEAKWLIVAIMAECAAID